jgi:uncharacterized protein (DUF697 family)
VKTTGLTRNRDYLSEHRRMIIGRSLSSAIAGAVPIPLLEEWMSSTIDRGTIRRIAEARGVDVDDDAVRAIADGPARPPEWTEIAGGTLAFRLLARSWKKISVAVLAARRARAASRSFTIATLFDHYCSKMHIGLGLDAASGAELRALMTEAIKHTPGGIGRRIFRRGAVAAAKASVRAPATLVDMVSGGMLTRLLNRGNEVEAADEVDEALERQLAAEGSFLSRAVTAVEFELAAEANPYIESLLDDFETKWRDRRHRGKSAKTETVEAESDNDPDDEPDDKTEVEPDVDQ